MRQDNERPSGVPSPASRRRALQALVIAAASAAWAACRRAASEASVPTLANVADIQTAIAAQTIATPGPATPEASPTPAGSEQTWPSVKRGPDGILVTWPITRFYETRYRWASPRPEIQAAEWRLTIEGWVQNPQSLSYAELRGLTAISQMRTLECISNPVGGSLIGNIVWRGVRLADVLALAGVRSGARELKMTAADGYQTSIPIDLANDPESLLVYEMDGAPLPVKHGYPLRVLLPGRYGQKQPKWITRLEVIADEFLGYWEARGWSNEARVQVNSQIWQPAALSSVSGPVVEISGIAFADEGGVSRVEVSTDGGSTWHEAELTPGPSPLVWTEWRYRWATPAASQPSQLTLAVRATDGHGKTQRQGSEESTLLGGTFPDGTSGIHQIVVTLR